MTLNLLKSAFIFNSLTCGLGGLLINFCERYLPASFSKLYRHGKFYADVKDAYLDKCEVPKRWFKHFYAFAVPLCTFTLGLMFHRYYLNGKLPDIVASQLYFHLGYPLQSFVPAENTFLALIIFTIHCWKRFYESHFISVYSDVYMNFTVYLIGLFHYFGSVMSIVGETYGLIGDDKIDLDWTRLTWLEFTCAIIFLTSTYLQYRTNIILSNLRRDKKGDVVTKKYKVPHGELFNYVSAPLQLTEIIMYICLSIILRSGSTIHFVTVWVIINQMECAYLTHEWSQRTLKDYPKSRKIILPFVF